jgi:hypothetical protein
MIDYAVGHPCRPWYRSIHLAKWRTCGTSQNRSTGYSQHCQRSPHGDSFERIRNPLYSEDNPLEDDSLKLGHRKLADIRVTWSVENKRSELIPGTNLRWRGYRPVIFGLSFQRFSAGKTTSERCDARGEQPHTLGALF